MRILRQAKHALMLSLVFLALFVSVENARVAALPTINLAPSSGTPTTVVTVSGTGFSGSDTTCIITGTGSIIGVPPATCGITSSTINAGVTFTVGNVAPGTYTITVTGSPGGDVATSTFTVTGPSLILNPSSGAVGTIVTVSGNGFISGETACTISGTGGIVTLPTACGLTTGSINGGTQFTVGNVASGTYTITVTGSPSGDVATSTFTVTATPATTITLNPSSGQAGVVVAVSGSGFAAADGPNTYACLSGSVVSLPSMCTFNGAGVMSASFTVNTVATGPYSVQVKGSTGDSASATFTVTTSVITVALNTMSGQTGVIIAVSGTGFAAADGPNTYACLSGSVVSSASTCTFNGAGVMSASFTVANVPTGTYSVQVKGSTGDSGSVTFTVVSQPSIALSLTSGPIGTTVSVTGSGFAPSDAGFACKISGTIVSSPTPCGITSAGTVAGGLLFAVYNVPAGTYTVTVQGSSGDQAQTSFTVTASHPTVTFNPTSGPTATTVTVTGTGFSPSDTGCVISPNAAGTVAGGGAGPTCNLSSGSLVSSKFIVGAVVAGTYTVTVQGTPTGDFAQATFTVTGPTITLNPTSGPQNTHVSVTGNGFELTDTCTSIASTPAGLITPTACSITSGQLTVAFTVNPGTPAGPLPITVTGSTGDVASAIFTVLTPTITLNPTIGQVGITVHVTGSGFDPTAIGCNLSGLPVASQSCSLTGGSLTGTFVTGGAPGSYTITANPGAGPPASANFQLTSSSPAIALNPTSAQVGSTVKVSGSGFSAGDTTCALSDAGAISSFTCSVSGGVLTASFVVAVVPAPGPFVITATGSPATDSASATLTVLGPTMTLSPSSGPAGITVHVSGTGFNPTATCISLTGPAAGIPIATQTCTISGGVLTGTFVVNTGVATGSYAITANPSVLPSAVANFQVTTTSPVITLNPSSAQVGATVSVSGTGFSPGDTICAINSLPGSIASQLCSISGGVLTASFVLANVPAGPYAITATGSPGLDTSNSVTLTVLSPTIALNPSSGPTGMTVHVTGSGFYTTASCNSLTGGGVISSYSCSLSGGTLTGSFVAVGAVAFYTISANPSVGNPATAQFQLTATSASISLNPASAHIGATVSVSGSGFSGGDNTCTLSGTGGSVAAGSTCSVSGNQLTGSFIVNNVAPGTYTITATASPGGETPTTTLTVLPPSIILNPSLGPGGITVEVTGLGFWTTATCTSLGGAPVLSQSCSLSSGTLTGKFITAGAPAGFYAILATPSAGPTATATFQLTTNAPTITLAPTSGPATTAVTITGSGFNPSDGGFACPSLSSPTNIVSLLTCNINTSGQIVAPSTFTVASTATPGVYTVTVTGHSGDFAQATFIVTAFSTTITLTPNSGPAGTAVTITGSGFNPSDSGSCSGPLPASVLSSPTNIVFNPTCNINTSGQIVPPSTFTVASTATPGVYTVTVKGSSGDFAQAAFTVTTPSPTITLAPNSGPAGTAVTITGSGFNPSDGGFACPSLSSPTNIVSLLTCNINTSGQIVAPSTFTVASTATPGVYTVTVTGHSGDFAQATFTVTGPMVSLTPVSGSAGAAVAVSGSGFATGAVPDTTCTIASSPGASIVTLGYTCLISNGKLTSASTFTVATGATPGTYAITVTGNQQLDSATTVFLVVQFAPKITLSPSQGPPSTSVTVSGSGFNPTDTCKITSSPASISTTFPLACVIDGSGNLTPVSFTVSPLSLSPGTYVVTVTGSKGDSASANFVVSSSSIQTTPTSGPWSTIVGFSGTFPAGSGFGSTCSIYGSPVTQQSCSIDWATGKFTGSYVVSNVAPGPYLITVTSGSTSLYVYFTVVAPFIQLSDPLAVGQPASGPIGSHVNIVGSYFSSSDTTCSLTSTTNGAIIVNGACAFFAGTGIFTGYDNVTGSFVVGNVPEGQYVIQVTGNTGDFAQAIFNVTAGAFIQLSCGGGPTCGSTGTFVKVGQVASGPTGTHVNIIGSQFLPNDAFNSATCSLSSPTSGSIIVGGACSFFKTPSGWVNVTGSFTAGNAAAGQYVIQVSGSAGDSAQAVFYLTSGLALSLSPGSGRIGIHVLVNGTGFLPSDTSCTLSSPTGAVITYGACAISTSTGVESGSFIVGNVAPGQYVIQVSGSSGDFGQTVFTVTSGGSVSLSPGSGRIGIHVLVNGTGFLAVDTSCTLSSPTGAIITYGACAVNAGTGTPGGSFTVGNVAPGQYVIQISATPGGDFAQAVFNVTVGPRISMIPASGRIGVHVLINGTGFLPVDNTCTISSPASTIVTVAGCAIQLGTGVPGGSFTVGNVQPGQYVIQITGYPGADFAQAVFNVTIGPTITLSPATGQIGTTVLVNGTGFLPVDSTCSITSPGSTAVLAGSAACSIVVGSGSPSGSFTIGNVLPGEYVIQVTGTPGGDFAQRVVSVTSGPTIALSPATGRPGTHVAVNGTGFLPTDTACTVTSPGSSAVLPGTQGCIINAGTGVTKASFTVGNILPGQYVIQVNGNQGDFAQGLLNVTSGPSLTLSAGTGYLGYHILVNGTGFLPTDQSCTVSSVGTLNPILPGSAACVITVGTGIVRASFTIGSVQPGQFVIEITGCQGNNGCTPSVGDFAQAILNVVGGASTLTLFPSSAATGVTVTFTAYGLSTSDTGCTILAYNRVTNTANNVLITSPTCSIVSPQTAQGSFVVSPYATTEIPWNLTVRGTPVNDLSAWALFNVTASLTVTPPTGTINTVFTYTGTGFSSLATACTATIIPPFPSGSSPGCYIGQGQVSGSVVAPLNTPPGTYAVRVLDNMGYAAIGVFTVGTPSAFVQLDPASVGQGQPVGVAGTGFNPNDTYCVITAGNSAVLFAAPPTCAISGGYASGSFTVSSTAPGGFYLITVTGYAQANGTPADFASNFLGVTLATTITTYSTTTSSATSSTSVTTTTTSVATSYSYSSTTYSTTGILFTTYSQFTITTVSAPTTTTATQTTSTTNTQTTVTVTTTTGFTTVSCGPLPCGFEVGSQGINPSPLPDSIGLLAVLLLILPMLLRRLFT